MKNLFLSTLVLMFCVVETFAGKALNLKDIANNTFRAEGLSAVKVLADGESYSQLSPDKKKILTYSFKNGKQTGVLFDVNNTRGAKVDKIDGYIISPTGKNILIQTNTKPIYRRSFEAVYYIFNVGNNRLEPLTNGGPVQTPVWSPDGYQVAFVRDNNIWLVKLLYGNAESQVTKDGKRNEIINGIPDWVNEEEFSFNSSMVFTADSRQIVWVRYDESKVKEYEMQLFKGLSPERKEFTSYPGKYTYKYPKAGEDNSRVSVLSYDIKSRQTRKINVPVEEDGYIPRIKATSDSSKIVVCTLNRHQDLLHVYVANPLTTVCQQIIEDKVDKYINESVFADLLITDHHLVLTSERNGYNSIYLYGLNGQLKRTVKQGVVTSVYGYDEKTGDLYFAATPAVDMPTQRQVYVSHANGKMNAITNRAGVNSAIFSGNFKYFINTWSDIHTPAVTAIYTVAGKLCTTLIDNKKLRNNLAQYDLGTIEEFKLTTSENVSLNGWMVKPRNFDVNKKYPVIMFQYGGPGSQQVLNQWAIGMSGLGAMIEHYLAQQGFIVVCVDNRGTGGRGAEFEKCTYLRLGELEARDQVETALWLGKQSYVDAKHIGIWGWSYGGWNTLMSMSEGRAVFAAGIAIAPPTSWRYYDTVYTERFMRTPKENASGYDEVNPIARASKLSGALLICHGLADDNVHYQNTAEYVEALVQADKDFRQIVYTNRNHGISGGNTRNHLYRQCVNFFNDNLK